MRSQQINNAVDHVFEVDPRQVFNVIADRAAERKRGSGWPARRPQRRQHRTGARQAARVTGFAPAAPALPSVDTAGG